MQLSTNPGENKIALFLPTLHGGGAERMMLNIARGITERGIDVDLVLASSEGPLLQYVPANVRVINLGVARVLESFRPLTTYLRRNQPISLLSTMGHANIIALWARRAANVRTRVVVREANTLSHTARHSRLARGRLFPMLIRFFYPWADGIIAVSEGVARDLSQRTGLPAGSVRVIYNPSISPEITAKAREPLEHPWFAPGEPSVLLGIGRLVEQKDFPTLIRAFHIVKERLPVRLIILGEGPERPRLESLIQKLGLENDVILPGFTENPYAYMARASIFVLSSAWEGFSNSLVEAMAVGAPVVSTDCESGSSEILLNGKYGRLAPVGDAAALADAISATLHKPPMPARLKERALDFTIERVVEDYLALLLDRDSWKDLGCALHK